MKKILLFIAILSIQLMVAQSPAFGWAKSITSGAGEITDITTDASGNVYTTGYFGGEPNVGPGDGLLAQVFSPTNPNANMGYNAFITKMSSNGSLIWTKTFGGEFPDFGKSIKVDNEGNVFVVGEFKGDADFNPDVASYILSSGSVYPNSGVNTFIVKFGPTGNFLFAKAFVGTYSQEVTDLAIDSAGKLYITGTFQSFSNAPTDFDPGLGFFSMISNGSCIFVIKLENNGDFIWAKQFKTISNGDTNRGNAIDIDANFNVFVSGEFSGTVDFDPNTGVSNLISAGNKDAFIAKLNPSGDLLWAKKIGNTGNDIGKKMKLDANGNPYIFGYFEEYNQQSLVDFDPNVGVVNLVLANNIQNAIVKLNNSGDFVWAKRCRGNTTTIINTFDVDPAGNCYVHELFSGASNQPETYDFDEGSGVFNLTSSTNGAYVSKIDSNGVFQTAFFMGTASNYVYGTAFAASAIGEMYAAGIYNATTDFDPTSGVFNLERVGSSNYLQKTTFQSLGVAQNTFDSSLALYPNPVTNILNIKLGANVTDAGLKISAITGQTILEKQNLSGTDFNFDVSHFSPGIYTIQIIDGVNNSISKFIKL